MSRLSKICEDVAEKLLGEPGTLVERMTDDCHNVVRGGIYKVTGSYGRAMTLEGSDDFTYLINSFRKAP